MVYHFMQCWNTYEVYRTRAVVLLFQAALKFQWLLLGILYDDRTVISTQSPSCHGVLVGRCDRLLAENLLECMYCKVDSTVPLFVPNEAVVRTAASKSRDQTKRLGEITLYLPFRIYNVKFVHYWCLHREQWYYHSRYVEFNLYLVNSYEQHQTCVALAPTKLSSFWRLGKGYGSRFDTIILAYFVFVNPVFFHWRRKCFLSNTEKTSKLQFEIICTAQLEQRTQIINHVTPYFQISLSLLHLSFIYRYFRVIVYFVYCQYYTCLFTVAI